MKFKYKTVKTLEERKQEYREIKQKNQNKIAIICEKDPRSKIVDIQKSKFLIEKDFTFPQFSTIIRKRLKLKESDALFFLANGKVSLSGNDTMNDIYKNHADEDGFLYLAYSSEEIFGNLNKLIPPIRFYDK